jgi:hypothetical protein
VNETVSAPRAAAVNVKLQPTALFVPVPQAASIAEAATEAARPRQRSAVNWNKAAPLLTGGFLLLAILGFWLRPQTPEAPRPQRVATPSEPPGSLDVVPRIEKRDQDPARPNPGATTPEARSVAMPSAPSGSPEAASAIGKRDEHPRRAHSVATPDPRSVAAPRASPLTAATSNRYEVSSSGTVYDTKTKLTWQRNVPPGSYTQPNAVSYCQRLTLAAGGWRLPTKDELVSIVDTTYQPTIDPKAFPDTPGDWFWSSSAYAGSSGSAWFVDFGFGYGLSNGSGGSSGTSRVRCVR